MDNQIKKLYVDYEAKNLFEICNIRYKRSQLEKNWVQSQS